MCFVIENESFLSQKYILKYNYTDELNNATMKVRNPGKSKINNESFPSFFLNSTSDFFLRNKLSSKAMTWALLKAELIKQSL